MNPKKTISINDSSIDDLDKLDKKMLNLMIAGRTTTEMSTILKKPLSTIQRRARQLEVDGDIITTREFNYRKYGYKTGLLHFHLTNGDSQAISKQISKVKGISCVSIHIGNSDIAAKYVCKSNIDMLDILASVKRLQGIERVIWSEQIQEIRDEKHTIEF